MAQCTNPDCRKRERGRPHRTGLCRECRARAAQEPEKKHVKKRGEPKK